MTTNLPAAIQFDPALLALIQAEGGDNSDLSSGIGAAFPVVSFKGKVWRVRYQGEARPVLLNGDPVPAILAVIVKANPLLSKVFYAGAYEEGGTDAPDCFSLDGIKPDASADKPQCATCAACPHNVWGSKITPQGTKTKACGDSRRLAVVPYPDIANEAYGGPMLLRVPPASFRELVRYTKELDDMGAQYSAVVTRIGFDLEAAFPKLTMKAVRALTVDEYRQVVAMRDLETVERMLSAPESDLANVAPDPGAEGVAPQGLAAQAQAAAGIKQATKPRKPAAAPAAAPAAPAAAPEPEAASEEDDELAAAEAALAEARAKAAAKKAAAAAPAPAPAQAPAAEKPATAAEAASATGVAIPAELSGLLAQFSN